MNNHVLEIYNEDDKLLLSIGEEVIEETTMLITVTGEITNEVSHEFEDEVMAALSVCKNLKLDFSKVTYIASMALKSLLYIQRIIDDMPDSAMLLINVSPQVMAILNETGFSDILEIDNN